MTNKEMTKRLDKIIRSLGVALNAQATSLHYPGKPAGRAGYERMEKHLKTIQDEYTAIRDALQDRDA